MVPSSTAASQTKRSPRSSEIATKHELLTKAKGQVKTLWAARKHLEKTKVLQEGEDLQLATWPMLLQIAAKAGKTTDTEAIKSVALLLQDAITLSQVDYVAGLIGEKVDDKISEMLMYLRDRRIEEMMDNEAALNKHLGEWKESLRRETDELQSVTNTMGSAVIEMAEHTATVFDQAEAQTDRLGDIINTEVTAAAEAAAAAMAAPPPPPPPPASPNPQPPTTTSYAAMVGHQIPASHTTTAARNDEKRRQSVIGTTSNNNLYPDISGLSELEILAKLKEAFDGMTVGKTLAPVDFAFLGVKKLRKGGATFNVNSDKAADWLRRGHIQANLVRFFGTTSTIKGYQFKVLAEFVLIGLEVNAPGIMRQLEETNRLAHGTIKELAWIKRIEKRTGTQKWPISRYCSPCSSRLTMS